MAEPAVERQQMTAPPTQPVLDSQLRAQRLRVVWWYSIGIAAFAAGWGVAFAVVARGRPLDVAAIGVITHVVALGLGGCVGYLYCRRGRLRHATYSVASALTLAGTANLACIANAEGAAVITYAAAVSLAALVIEPHEWLWWGAIITTSALIGALLHTDPPWPLLQLPPALAAASLLLAAPLGLAVPMGLFVLFSRNLTDSREEAWRLARQAAEASRLATERAAELERRTAQLQAKNTELNDFLYVVSHDLRAPLINLEGFSGSLRDAITALDGFVRSPMPDAWRQIRADIDESLDFIVRSVRRMEFLVNALLELSRLDSRPPQPERLDVNALVREVLDGLAFRIEARGIDVQVDRLPVLTTDRLGMTQVFGNLLDNAVKYMPPEGEAAIHVGCEMNGSVARFFVRDTGVGIRPEDQAKVFRLFARVGDRTVPGDGIGLTAVRRILEKLGGTITLESTPGRGSTFWVTLPAEQAVG